MKKIVYYCFMAFAVIALSACSAEDGKDGIDGQQGPQGDPGTANVMYSDWINIAWNIDDEADFKAMHIDEDRITDDFIENGGTILMYVKQVTPTGEYAVIPLPCDFGNDRFVFFYANAPSLAPVGILLQVFSLGSNPVSEEYDNGSYTIRYMLIPGGTPLSDPGAKDLGDIDLGDYRAVADFLKIE